MKRSGTIVRLIDVVMILLLGFLSISDIVHKKEIKLPSGRKKTESPQQSTLLRLRIQIVPSDTTIDSLQSNNSLIAKSQQFVTYSASEDEKSFRIRNLDQLEDELRKTKAMYDSMLVIIAPDSNSIVQGTINLIDICRRNHFKRMFDYPSR